MNKLRVWWIPQVGACDCFYIPVSTPEEGKKVMDILAAYDLFQLNKNIKPDFCNAGGLEVWNEEEQDWCDWYMETEYDYFDDVDEYCESESCPQKEELESLRDVLFSQVVFNEF